MDNTRANVLSMWFTHISHGVRYAVQNTSCFQNVNRYIYIYIYIYICMYIYITNAVIL